MTRYSSGTPIPELLRQRPECCCSGCGADNVRKVIITGIRLCNACEEAETVREAATDDFLRVPGMELDLDPMMDHEEDLMETMYGAAAAPVEVRL